MSNAMRAYRRILNLVGTDGVDLSEGTMPTEVVDLLVDQGDGRVDHTGSLLSLTLQGRERAASDWKAPDA